MYGTVDLRVDSCQASSPFSFVSSPSLSSFVALSLPHSLFSPRIASSFMVNTYYLYMVLAFFAAVGIHRRFPVLRII